MEMEYLTKPAMNVFTGEGGSYSFWSPSDSPILVEAKVGGARLVLRPLGFALPHYADSSKVGFVLQGTCGVVGMLPPLASEEKVNMLKEGDIIPVPLGSISWWFNDGRDGTDLVIVFLGDTSSAHVPGMFNYFFLAGPQGILAGFSPEIISRAYGMDPHEVTELTKSQPNPLIVKLEASTGFQVPPKTEAIVVRLQLPKEGKSTLELTGSKVPLLEQAGLSVQWKRVEADDVLGPIYSADSSTRVLYMVKGSGRVEIVGLNGQRCLDKVVKEGELVVVPKFFAVAAIAGGDGMECVTVTTSPRPILTELVGKASPWKGISPAAIEAALHVTPSFLKSFLSNIDQLS